MINSHHLITKVALIAIAAQKLTPTLIYEIAEKSVQHQFEGNMKNKCSHKTYESHSQSVRPSSPSSSR
jgi:hypothetical protein